MLKRFFTIALLICAYPVLAQLKTPEQFLGYKIGTRFTPHSRIIDYFKSVAAAVPSMVKLEQYGLTNEGRPLVMAYISTAGNISNLDAIRTSNLRLSAGAASPVAGSQPVVVWLSYNVHGNEASSSEASLLTLYSLVAPNRPDTKQWLQNTVVIIDPCLNPDGRDRYVNWYNSVVGTRYNPSPIAREHREPWPGGRTNHYNFDLNRDWAWQTQVESQQRMKLFNAWLPEVHVDFHEQGYNEPYYFAPAAEPYHKVITPFQREFQATIGRNHARYFDEKGWLYFTKERFDLLYPSYGDTYPLYNGSIGMTYEQGGIGAGLAVRTEDGDTLTLADRVQHHFTTSLSTLEVASKNAERLLQEFQKFYKDATAGKGNEYNTYVIKNTPVATQRLQALLTLLDRNGIQYAMSKGGQARGYNYSTGKKESFSTTTADIVISALQPKGTMVRVLFEPNVTLVDTATYDITAWSLPYVYGVQAYATDAHLQGTAYSNPLAVTNPATDAYGYIIRWNGIQTVKLVGQLLQQGIKLRFSEEPFTANGQLFDRGSVIVLKTGNQNNANLWNGVRELATASNVQLIPVTTGFVEKGYDFGSPSVHPLKLRRVALLTGEGVGSNAAGEVWHFFDQQINYPLTLINVSDIARLNWSDYDVLIMPDGNYRFLSDKSMADQFHNWINGGGNVIAMEGAVAQLARQDWSLRLKKDDSDSKDIYETLRKYENRERDIISTITPGSIFKVELDNTHPLAFGYPTYYYTLKQDDNIYEFIKENGWNVGVIKKGKQVSGFVGSRLQNRLKDGLLFGVQQMGSGTITYLADDVLFRSFWENGKLLFSNAVFLVGQ